MKSIIKIFIILLFVPVFFSCVTKRNLPKDNTTILPLGDMVNISDGSLVYALPLTVIHFTVTVEHEFEKPGTYAKYAGEYLGLKDVITEENEFWTIKNVDVQTYQELDPSEYYVIESNTLFQSNVLSLKKEGLILDLNPEIYNMHPQRGSFNENSFDGFQFTDMGANEYYLVSRDTSYRVVEIDTAFIRIPYLVEKKKQLGVDILAENAAKTLLELRDGKQMILTGEANVYPQDPSAINEMNRMENEYLALFAGKSWKESKTYTYDIIPSKSMLTTPLILFKFSEMTGVMDPSATSGSAVNVEFIPALKTKDLSYISSTKPVTDKEKKFDKLYYRVPDVVNIKVNSGKDVISDTRKLIYQFGEVIPLPANYIIGK